MDIPTLVTYAIIAIFLVVGADYFWRNYLKDNELINIAFSRFKKDKQVKQKEKIIEVENQNK